MTILLPVEFTVEPLRNCLATVAAGVSLTSVIFAILTGQVWLYLRKTSIHGRDPLWIKSVVVFIWMVQALGLALTSHMTALAHGNVSSSPKEAIQKCLWEWSVYVAVCATTECLVHAYFVSRIYILETNQNHVISIVLSIFLLLEGAFGFVSLLASAMSGFQGPKYVILCWPFPIWLGLSIWMDISIAGSIYYLLKKDGPFTSLRLALVVQRLTKFCIQTGLITSLVTGVTVILWIVIKLDLDHLLMSLPTSGVYATCFMSNLIARDSYFHLVQPNEDDENFGVAISNITFATPQDSVKSES